RSSALAERLARILQRMFDELALLAAPRHGDFDPAPGAGTQRLLQQFALLRLLRQEDEARARLVVIELRQEGGEDLAGRRAGAGARKMRAVAPVLARAEEEDLDAAVAALAAQGNDVGCLDSAGVDALMALDLRQCRQPVAIEGGALEIERGGGRLHCRAQFAPHPSGLAGEKVARLLHQPGIFDMADLAGTRGRAAPDL